MSMPALTPVRTLYGVRPPLVGAAGSVIWWMPSQSLMTNPSKPICPLRVPVMSSWWACIFSGPALSSVQSTLENDGITDPTWWSCTAGTYCRSATSQKSWRLVTEIPWSIL